MARQVELLYPPVLVFAPAYLTLVNLIQPRTYEEWMEYDFGVIEHCDALLRMSGESPGADREVRFALSKGLSVFHQYGGDVHAEFPGLVHFMEAKKGLDAAGGHPL